MNNNKQSKLGFVVGLALALVGTFAGSASALDPSMMMGVPRNDAEKVEVAHMKLKTALDDASFWGKTIASGAYADVQHEYDELMNVAGLTENDFGPNGRLHIENGKVPGNFDDRGMFAPPPGHDRTALAQATVISSPEGFEIQSSQRTNIVVALIVLMGAAVGFATWRRRRAAVA